MAKSWPADRHHLIGSSGTRPSTLEVAVSLRERVETDCGPLPFVLLLNQNDVHDDWALSDTDVDDLRRKGWWVRSSSARTGEGVDDAFKELAIRTTR